MTQVHGLRSTATLSMHLSHATKHKRLLDDGGQCRGGLRLVHGQRITAPSFCVELATTLSSGLSVGARRTLWSGATTCTPGTYSVPQSSVAPAPTRARRAGPVDKTARGLRLYPPARTLDPSTSKRGEPVSMQGPGAWLWSEASNAMTWPLLQAKRAASPASGGEGTTASVVIVAPCREAARGKGVRWSPSP